MLQAQATKKLKVKVESGGGGGGESSGAVRAVLPAGVKEEPAAGSLRSVVKQEPASGGESEVAAPGPGGVTVKQEPPDEDRPFASWIKQEPVECNAPVGEDKEPALDSSNVKQEALL